MTPQAEAALAEFRRYGIELRADRAAGRIKYRPVQAMTPALLDLLQAVKPELLDVLPEWTAPATPSTAPTPTPAGGPAQVNPAGKRPARNQPGKPTPPASKPTAPPAGKTPAPVDPAGNAPAPVDPGDLPAAVRLRICDWLTAARGNDGEPTTFYADDLRGHRPAIEAWLAAREIWYHAFEYNGVFRITIKAGGAT